MKVSVDKCVAVVNKGQLAAIICKIKTVAKKFLF